MIVFWQFESRSIRGIAEENDVNTFYYMLSYIPSMSEVRCSNLGIDEECIDLTKAKSFVQINKDVYHDIFSTKQINLMKVGEDINLYDWNPRNNILGRKISSPVSVYDPISKKTFIGVLEVYMYVE